MDPIGRESEAEVARPKSRRRPGTAIIKGPKREADPPSFDDDLRNSFQLVLVSVVAPALLVFAGVVLATVHAESNLQRAGGVGLALLGSLVIASYFFRFTAVLQDHRWTETRIRRGVRYVLRYSWRTYITIGGVLAALVVLYGLFE